ncbi:hypothetical protein FA95DRAFT_1682920 [Auriscalpium vulgare]|uniref:Uncharacterized protein n=1 Tax=Auriscalpium vulgare TaxID=40419 RepID=A0ACB8RE01_9AGAM|nr:hypothetical protein FA95DRAFT_1682920 [Auriscalpium vulgare]
MQASSSSQVSSPPPTSPKSRSSLHARLSRSMSDGTDTRPRPPSRPLQASSSRDSKASLPRQKIKALENFVRFGRKGKAKDEPPTFPPSSWLLDSASSSPQPQEEPFPESVPTPQDHFSSTPPPELAASKPLYQRSASANPGGPPELSNNLNRAASAETGVDRVHAEGSAFHAHADGSVTPTLERPYVSMPGTPFGEPSTTAPEPLSLAKRIQALISSRAPLPTPSATDATTSSGASDSAAPLTPARPVEDSGLMALLSNASIMGGSLDKGRQSVFAILDRLRSRPPPPAAGASEAGALAEDPDSDDDGSVMLYAPLEPDEDSEVELARSDIMSVYDDGETVEYERPAQRLSMLHSYEPRSPLSSSTVLPPALEDASTPVEAPAVQGEGEQKEQHAGWFETWKGKLVEGSKVWTDKVAEGTKALADKATEGSKIVKTKIRWVPSPDKISFQATWWGYRLYLPPPVLDVLNNKRLEAAKRAAILTAALQWLLGHVPLTVVPPQFRPGLLIAQRLVPYLGYIGGFVAWSWGAMKSFDKGQGIVLTATWLLPVALIPGTWEADASIFPQAQVTEDTMTTRGATQSTPAASTPKRTSKSASSQSLNHLLNFTLPPRQTQIQSLPRRSRRNGPQYGVWNKERFVNAQYRFVMNPLGDYTVHFADPDIFFQWHDILQVIIPRNSALASAAGGGDSLAQEEGHTTCPICLSPPTAPRMTKCGHVFCFPCILHYLNTSDNLKWVRCPICFDSVNEKQLKSVHWFDPPAQPENEPEIPRASSSAVSADACAASAPRPGSMLRMRLMQRPQITTLALPRSPTWPSDLLPPHQAPFHFLPDVYMFSKFMLATPQYLVENLSQDLNELAEERRTLTSMGDILGLSFVDAAEAKLKAQIAKAEALDTEPLRDAIDRALLLEHEIRARVSHHERRRLGQASTSDSDPVNNPDAYLSARQSTATPPAPARAPKQRKNVNPPPHSTSTYYYYQAASGMPIFLPPLEIKILNAHFQGYASFPDTITVRVESIDEGSVDDDLRKRCKYLAHIPEGADVVFTEADLSGVVGAEGLRAFEGALKARRAKRKEKGRKDDRARARAEEREREKLSREYPAHQAHFGLGFTVGADAGPGIFGADSVEEPTEREHEPPAPPPSGAWGARSFASTLHAAAPTRTATRPRAREMEEDWDVDAAWHELEQRAGGGSGGRRKKGNKMVVLGSGPGRRR